MKKQIIKSILFSLVVAALVTLPAVSRAQETASTNAPAASGKKPAVHGKVAAVDAAAMTITVGKETLSVTSTTKISKDSKPATLEDIKVGDTVNATYKTGDDGKLSAVMIRDGVKAMKKKKIQSTDSSTNAAPATAN